MKISLPAAVAGLVALILPLNSQCSAHRLPIDLPNFFKVSAALFRGGQPTELGLHELKDMGVKTVISLRHNRSQVAWEQKEAEKDGFTFKHLPLDGLHKISSKTINQFFAIVDDPANQPVFVHCQWGMDRTGSLVAIYREEKDHWSARHAYDEMVSKGFEKKYVWLADSVFDYEEDKTGKLSNQRPTSVKMVDTFEGAVGTRPHFRSSEH